MKKAFSLLEVICVIALISILTAFTLPAFSDHLVKARVTELLLIANSYKLKILNNEKGGTFPVKSEYATHVEVNTDEKSVTVFAKMQIDGSSGIGLSGNPMSLKLIQELEYDTTFFICRVPEEYLRYAPKTCSSE